MESAVFNLGTWAATFAASFLLGATKKYTGLLDARIGAVVKPLQPLLLTVAGIGLPALASALGVGTVDPEAFVSAPAATLIAVTARETLRRLSGAKRPRA